MKSKTPWVVAGGAVGESAHCERCGEGLKLGTQRVEVMVAAWKAFAKIHSTCRETGRKEEAMTLKDWPNSRDTGISSATIYEVFTDLGFRLYGKHFDVPHDPADFGSCYRLLTLAPQWEARLQEVADAFPAWGPFVREWPRLKDLYERAIAAKGKERDKISGELYYAMKALEEEGR